VTWNQNRKRLACISVALIAVSGAGNGASAQSAYRGKFDLPFEARWGQTVLPPGQYSFALDRNAVGGMVRVRGEGGAEIQYVMSDGGRDQQRVSRSELILVRDGGVLRISSMRLAGPGLVLEYPLPARETTVLAQAPVLIQSVPVSLGER
jgi:hypothetical protein